MSESWSTAATAFAQTDATDATIMVINRKTNQERARKRNDKDGKKRHWWFL